MTNLIQSSVEISKTQADTLLWCYEQMYIDLSDAEIKDLEPVINQLEGLIRS